MQVGHATMISPASIRRYPNRSWGSSLLRPNNNVTWRRSKRLPSDTNGTSFSRPLIRRVSVNLSRLTPFCLWSPWKRALSGTDEIYLPRQYSSPVSSRAKLVFGQPVSYMMARVYADVNDHMPRSYWDYDSVNISWGVLENYEVVRKIGKSSVYQSDLVARSGALIVANFLQAAESTPKCSKVSTL
jgi:hypothetical protein